jgi:acyl carrier protein
MVFEKIKEIICDQLGVDANKVNLDTSFDDLGVDSLDLFQIIIEIEEKFDIRIEDTEGIKTVSDVVDFVEERIAK